MPTRPTSSPSFGQKSARTQQFYPVFQQAPNMSHFTDKSGRKGVDFNQGGEDEHTHSRQGESKVDSSSSGIVERVRYEDGPNGKKVKVIMKVKVTSVKVKTPKRVEARRDLPRFGEAKLGEKDVTLISKETIQMEHPDDALVENADKASAATLVKFIEKAAMTKLARETGLNPLDIGDNMYAGDDDDDTPAKKGAGGDSSESAGAGGAKPAKYVPPGALAKLQGLDSTGVAMPGTGSSATSERPTTIRVSNLTKNVGEMDLRDLFERFGRLVKVNIPKTEDRVPKGYAFIQFANPTDADEAFKMLQGFGYDHLILNLEWAADYKRPDGPGGPGGDSMRYASGYGTKLAQDTKEKIHGYTDQAMHRSTGGVSGR